jgi:branched-chain amino acid transport system substrate-binding protein
MPRRLITAAAILAALLVDVGASAEPTKTYGPGVTDTEIKLGQTAPFSGPVSFYAVLAKVAAAYFRMINDDGGINGRTITLVQVDDAYSPPRSVEAVRRLVEEDRVLALFDPIGTAPNTAIRPYLNKNQVPQLFVSGGASKWGDPKSFPWTIGWAPPYSTEAHIYARYILAHYPNAKIGVLYQNDDFGKEFLRGLRDGLGERAGAMVVAAQSYEVTDPTVDSQLISLSQSGADVFLDATTPKFAVQAIRKADELQWHPVHFLDDGAAFIGTVFVPAGIERAKGILSAAYLKDPGDQRWSDDPGMLAWTAFMKKYLPEGDRSDIAAVYGYGMAMTMAQVIRQCGDDLSRENLMRQATNLRDFQVPVLLPGVKINTSPTSYYPIKQDQLIQFDGSKWVPIDALMSD